MMRTSFFRRVDLLVNLFLRLFRYCKIRYKEKPGCKGNDEDIVLPKKGNDEDIVLPEG